MREVGFRPDSPGGFGEYLILEENYLHKLPPDWTYEEGALVEPFSVGYYGLWGPGGWVDASDDVIILGSGTIGLSALIVCKTAGARVVMIEPLAIRREYARRFDADVVLDPAEFSDLPSEVFKRVGTTRGPSVLVEASGNDAAIASLFELAGLQPRVRLIGHSIGRRVPLEIGRVLWRGISIYGEGGTTNFLARTIRFMSQARKCVDLQGLISHKVPFDQLDKAMEIAVTRKDEALKVMVTF